MLHQNHIGLVSCGFAIVREAQAAIVLASIIRRAWVFGIRHMFDVADANASRTIQTGPYAGYSAELKNNWLDLLTGRIGYAAQPNWLLYFQGGAAWRKNSLTFFNPGGAEVFDASRTRTGWTVGSEWKFAPNWSAFVEYNHADFGTNSGILQQCDTWPRRAQCKV
jgi:opacity protein-like surface antigen